MAIDGQVRRDVAFAQGLHEALDIEALVAAHGDPPFAGAVAVDQVEGGVAFGRAGLSGILCVRP